jgi:hypothetical protein
MATAGYLATIKLGGTPTTLTNEATTDAGDHNNYQITAATKRVLDTATAVVVEVDADGAGGGGYAVADPTTYALDYLTGKVTFAVAKPAAALVRVSGKYIPLLTVATAHNFDAEWGREEIDCGAYGDAAGKVIAGRQVASGTLEVYESLVTDHDAGAGALTLAGIVGTNGAAFLDWQPAGTGNHFRAWAHLSTASVKAALNSAVGATLKWRAVTREVAGRIEKPCFSWAP